MSDFDKCRDDTCPLRKDCYRFMAEHTTLEWFSIFPWTYDVWKEVYDCDGFIKIEKDENTK